METVMDVAMMFWANQKFCIVSIPDAAQSLRGSAVRMDADTHEFIRWFKELHYNKEEQSRINRARLSISRGMRAKYRNGGIRSRSVLVVNNHIARPNRVSADTTANATNADTTVADTNEYPVHTSVEDKVAAIIQWARAEIEALV